MMRKVVGITGGIGSGKSVVSQICRVLGYPVYDCDFEAKRIMNGSQSLKNKLCDKFGENVLTLDNIINRQYLASVIFSNRENLEYLNSIVHEEVRRDISRWMAVDRQKNLFIESAILFTSGLDEMVDEIWNVEADIETRIRRVMMRNSLSRENVIRRIDSQRDELLQLRDCHKKVVSICNNGNNSLLIQINQLIKRMS